MINETDDMPIGTPSIRPVNMSEVFKAARMVRWSERMMLFLYPWPTLVGNIIMWLILGGMTILSVMVCIMASKYSLNNVPFLAATMFLSAFSIGTIYVSQVTSGLSEQLAERMRKLQLLIREQLQASADAYGEQFAQTLKNVTGKEIKPDPISMAAAVLDVTEKAEEKRNKPTNPLRALLDGTLNPDDLMNDMPPHDDDEFYN